MSLYSPSPKVTMSKYSPSSKVTMSNMYMISSLRTMMTPGMESRSRQAAVQMDLKLLGCSSPSRMCDNNESCRQMCLETFPRVLKCVYPRVCMATEKMSLPPPRRFLCCMINVKPQPPSSWFLLYLFPSVRGRKRLRKFHRCFGWCLRRHGILDQEQSMSLGRIMLMFSKLERMTMYCMM